MENDPIAGIIKMRLHKSTRITQIVCLMVIVLLFSAGTSIAREKKWKVKKIEFAGNETFNQAILLTQMELKPVVLFSSVVFTEYKLRSDIAALERFYQSQGFLNVHIKKGTIVRDSSKHRVKVDIEIKENKRFIVNAFEIHSDNELSDSTLIESMRTKIGNPLIATQIEDDTRKIKERFMQGGYLSVKVFSDVTIDTMNFSAKISIQVVDGPVMYVDSIIISGNKGLNQKVVRRELNFKKNDKLTIGKIRKSERKLYRTNHFSYARVTPVIPDSAALRTQSTDTSVSVQVDVDESDFFKIEAGAGYGTADGVRGYTTTSYGNMFGIGHKLTLLGNLSQKQQQAESRYSVPWFLALPLKFDILVYMRNQTDAKNTFNALFRGLELTVGQQTDFHFAYRLWVKWEDITKLTTSPDVKNTQSIGADLVWDTRDGLINVSRGTYNQVRVEVAGLTDKRSSEFVKVTTDSRFYWLLGIVKSSSALRLGWSTTFGTTDSLPLQERFFGGGSRTVRGFDEGRLRSDPITNKNLSGTTSLIANIIEIRFPLVWWFEGAVFADAGYIWIRENGEYPDFRSLIDELRWTAGTGIRFNSPVAVVRLDAGFKLDKKPGEKPMRLHLDIGNSF